ncbi:MAG: N-acetyltransferase [Acidobacteria bacterium]|nr:N-acetyltransferase [Acidobacteriota bacterium]
MRTRKALLPDAIDIHRLILQHFASGTLLPRTFPEICENVRDFVVAEEGDSVVGCGALHLYGPHLAEVRSITVGPEYRKRGAGRLLLHKLLKEAARHQVSCVCLFTRIPEFFARAGFSMVRREDIPDKLYKDCCVCPKLHCCDEVAMVRGQLPRFAILSQPAPALVKLEI